MNCILKALVKRFDGVSLRDMIKDRYILDMYVDINIGLYFEGDIDKKETCRLINEIFNPLLKGYIIDTCDIGFLIKNKVEVTEIYDNVNRNELIKNMLSIIDILPDNELLCKVKKNKSLNHLLLTNNLDSILAYLLISMSCVGFDYNNNKYLIIDCRDKHFIHIKESNYTIKSIERTNSLNKDIKTLWAFLNKRVFKSNIKMRYCPKIDIQKICRFPNINPKRYYM